MALCRDEHVSVLVLLCLWAIKVVLMKSRREKQFRQVYAIFPLARFRYTSYSALPGAVSW